MCFILAKTNQFILFITVCMTEFAGVVLLWIPEIMINMVNKFSYHSFLKGCDI
jgi:hypothetical protein